MSSKYNIIKFKQIITNIYYILQADNTMSSIKKYPNTKKSDRDSDFRSNNPVILQISELESRYQQRHKECLNSDSKYNSKSKKESHHYESQASSKANTKRTSKQKQNFKSPARSKHTQSIHESRITYPGLCRIVEQRNGMIQAYEKQICSLIQQVSGLRKQNECLKNQQAGFKNDEIKRLREYQASNQTNLKELEILKQGISQMKAKVDQLTMQKKSLVTKYNQALKETEEMTVKFNSLLNQARMTNQSRLQIQQLTEELQSTKKKYVQSKEAQQGKSAAEERCRNLQKKINEYIGKYNEVQTDNNQLQLKYFRIQRQNDQLTFQQQESQGMVKSLRQQIQDEKNWHIQELDRLKKKWRATEEQLASQRSRLDETAKSRVNFSQQINERHEQLLRSRQNERALIQQKQELQEKVRECDLTIRQCKKLYEEHLQIYRTEKVCYQSEKRTFDNRIRLLQQKNEQLHTQLSSLKHMNQKVGMLIQQNNRLCDLIKKKQFEIQCKSNEIIHIKMQCSNQSEINTKIASQLTSKDQLIIQKQSRVTDLEQILADINMDLNSVKQEVQSYRLHVQNIQQEKRKLQKKQGHYSSETQRLNQDVQFYKTKFESIFAQNKEKSSKLGKLQMEIQQYSKKVILLEQTTENQKFQIKNLKDRTSSQKQQEIYQRQLQKSNLILRQSELQKKLDELAKQLYYHRQKNLQLEQRNGQYQNNIQRIEFDKKITMQQTKQEYDQKERVMRTRILQLEKQKQSTTKNAQTIVKKARGLETEIPHLNNRIKELQRQLSEEQQTNKKSTKQLNIFKQEHQCFEQTKRKYENCLKEIKILRDTVDSIEHKLCNSERTVTTLTNQLSNLMQNNTSPDITLRSRLQCMEESRYQINRQLDSSKLAIEIIKNQNQNLQRIMADQLNKRKSIIEDLVREKQGLYEQIRRN